MLVGTWNYRAQITVFVAFLLTVSLLHPAYTQLTQPRNFVANGDFENGLTNWSWNISLNALATASIVTGEHHSGQASVLITNKTHLGPNVYGTLQQTVNGLNPDTVYELSAWVEMQGANNCWMGGGPGWQVRQALPSNTQGWQRVSTTFKTGPSDTSWLIVINTDSVTGKFLLDDVAVNDPNDLSAMLFPPTTTAGAGTGSPTILLVPGKYSPGSYDVSEHVTGQVTLPTRDSVAASKLTLTLTDPSGSQKDIASMPLGSQFGNTRTVVQFDMPASLLSRGANTLAVVDDSSPVQITNISVLRKDLTDLIQEGLPAVRSQFKAVSALAQSKHLSTNGYVRLGLTVASRYIDRIANRGMDGRQSPYWSILQLREISQVLIETSGLIISSPGDAATPTGKPQIDQGVLSIEGRPAFYGGYGAWDQAANDIPVFPSMGASIIQQEAGPSNLSKDGTLSLDAQKKVFDRAQANGVKISFLLSPHYFPDWAREASPAVTIPNHQFITYNIDHPIARQVIGDWLRGAIGQLADEPALLSFCLSNEPAYSWSGRDTFSHPLWTKFLSDTHRSIDVLNKLYGTSYTSFDQVPPPPIPVPDFNQPVEILRAYYDWMNFNNRHFADWHEWMNGIIKNTAPKVSTDIKIMAGAAFDRGSMYIGVDPEQFCAITNFAGNDDYMFPVNDGRYALEWQLEESGYDLLRSFHDQPSINSENHLIPDRFTEPVPMEYARTVMWQGALHGQAATVTWVWGEAGDQNDDLYGSIYYRPADVFGAGRAWLDAERLSGQVASIIRLQPHVAILYSRTSLFWQSGYANTLETAYAALDFSGEPVTFVTEQELKNGDYKNVKIILLPQATHVTDSTVDALLKFVSRGGKLVSFGSGNLSKDQYDRSRQIPAALCQATLDANDDEEAAQRQLLPILKSVGCYIPLYSHDTGRQTYGVEYRRFNYDGKSYVSAINLMSQPQHINAMMPGPGSIKDLLSGENLDESDIEMPPMQPRMLAAR